MASPGACILSRALALPAATSRVLMACGGGHL